jgi:RNA polymerase sigma-70 factor (ECF subfamily)
MTKIKQQHIYKTWLEEHKSLLFKVIRVYADSETDRDDLFQEISIQVWRSIPNFRKESAVTTWLYRVALNTAIKWNRDERKHQDGRHTFENVEHLLQKNEQQRDGRLDWLYEEIGKLDEIDRSLCLLMLDGFSYGEMSDILGISESNVGVKIHRVKKHLVTQSEKYDYYGI